jgi:hypothetical protein
MTYLTHPLLPWLLSSGVGVRLQFPDVENVLMKHLIRGRSPAQADLAVWPKILMNPGDLMSLGVPICEDLTQCAERFPSKWRARVPSSSSVWYRSPYCARSQNCSSLNRFRRSERGISLMRGGWDMSALDLEISYHVARYINGDESLADFRRWLLPIVWDLAEPGNDQDASRLASRIELRLAEFLNGHWTEDDLRVMFVRMIPATSGLAADLSSQVSGVVESGVAEPPQSRSEFVPA